MSLQHPLPEYTLAKPQTPAVKSRPRTNISSVTKMSLACALSARLCQKRWVGIDDVVKIQEEIGISLCRRSTQRLISGLLKEGMLVLHPRQRGMKSPANITFGLNPAHPYAGVLVRMAYPDRLVD